MNAWLGDRSVVVTLRSVNVLVRFMIVLSMMVCVCVGCEDQCFDFRMRMIELMMFVGTVFL